MKKKIKYLPSSKRKSIVVTLEPDLITELEKYVEEQKAEAYKLYEEGRSIRFIIDKWNRNFFIRKFIAEKLDVEFFIKEG